MLMKSAHNYTEGYTHVTCHNFTFTKLENGMCCHHYYHHQHQMIGQVFKLLAPNLGTFYPAQCPALEKVLSALIKAACYMSCESRFSHFNPSVNSDLDVFA